MLVTPSRAKALWYAWGIFILLVGILPLHNFVGHAHWQYIRWVPTPDQLSSPAILLDLGVDAVANILLFVPFGLLYALRGLDGQSPAPRHLLLMAFALSFSIEYYQVYCHNRSTSLLDLLDNVLGAYLGMKAGEVYVRKSAPAVVEPAA
ncbi:MAG: VanZ domain-containing protein [Nitrospira sp.]|nr:MAG: VanZ domain-containing protein [Nitrospira sp.]